MLSALEHLLLYYKMMGRGHLTELTVTQYPAGLQKQLLSQAKPEIRLYKGTIC